MLSTGIVLGLQQEGRRGPAGNGDIRIQLEFLIVDPEMPG